MFGVFKGLDQVIMAPTSYLLVILFPYSITNLAILGLFVSWFCVVESGSLFAMFHFPGVWSVLTEGFENFHYV